MTSHELANLLLSFPDLPITTVAMGHSYCEDNLRGSHGPLMIGKGLTNYGTQTIAVGDMLRNTSMLYDLEVLHSGRE